MDDKQFTHLHVHSEYSLLDEAAGVGKLIRRAQEPGHEQPGPDGWLGRHLRSRLT